VVILKMTTKLGEIPIDQSGEPPLGISELEADKTTLSTQQLELFALWVARLQGGEITVPHGAGNKECVICISGCRKLMLTALC